MSSSHVRALPRLLETPAVTATVGQSTNRPSRESRPTEEMQMLDRTRVLRSLLLAVVLTASSAAVSFAAANPSGTGQPSQSCQDQPAGPPGLLSTTNGFARVAVNVYAGSPGTPSLA